MKTILWLAAAAATFAGASAASAHDLVQGHWEWRSPVIAGPKSIAPARTRVWVADSTEHKAACDCPMPGGNRAPSAG